MMNYLDKNKYTAIGKTLIDLLYEIWDNDHFVLGVLVLAKGDKNRQKMIDKIKNGLTDRSQITLTALAISQNKL